MKKISFILSLLVITRFWMGCSDFLDVKPNNKMMIPQKGEDLMALLNDVSIMNYGYSTGLSEIASDNIDITPSVWEAIFNEEDRRAYVWTDMQVSKFYWNPMYKKINTANVVLDHLDKVSFIDEQEREEIHGTALLFRGYSYFSLAQNYCKPYHPDNFLDQGLVIRHTSDVNEVSVRSSIEESYKQIISDLTLAADLLPESKTRYPTRPNKAAAYAVLARVYLSMNDFEKAAFYADACLKAKVEVMDYSNVTLKPYPFDKFNEEVLFYTQHSGHGILLERVARVDSLLYQSYHDGDYRKRLYFSEKENGTYAFTGDYAMNSNVDKFNGITTAEVVLIFSECLARNGELESAASILKMLLLKRYEPDSLPVVEGLGKKDLLERILSERRKELIFRGVRWSDLRRLTIAELGVNKWERRMGEVTYVMTKERLQDFAFKIPQEVIDLSGIQQN